MCEVLQYVWIGGDLNLNWKICSLKSNFYEQVPKNKKHTHTIGQADKGLHFSCNEKLEKSK